MRFSVSNRECVHLWAHQTQSYAKGNSISFRGEFLYSYAATIGRIVKGTRNREAVIITTDTYSVTTSRHCTYASNATNHMTRFYLPLRAIPNASGKDIVKFAHEYLKKQIRESIDKASRARVYKDSHLRYAQHYANQFNQLAEFFGSRKRIKLPENFDAMMEMARQEKIALDKKNRARQLQLEKERAERHQQAMKELADAIPQWQRLEINYIPNVHLATTCYLRFIDNGQIIQTSQGAQFPAGHGKRAYKILARLKKRGQEYKRNGHTIHCGHYPIDTMDQFGIKAGCHRLNWEVLNEFAQSAGWNNKTDPIDSENAASDNAENGYPATGSEPNEGTRFNRLETGEDSRGAEVDQQREPAQILHRSTQVEP